MQKSTFDTPALFGDHHVTEVRRLLFEMTGVTDVYASSAFRVVEVVFDESKLGHEDILRKLDEMGYLMEIPMMAEAGVAAIANPLINITIQGRHDTYPKRRGMTRVPAVQEKVKKLIGKDPHKGVNPDEVVAVGAVGRWSETMLAEVDAKRLEPARKLGLPDARLTTNYKDWVDKVDCVVVYKVDRLTRSLLDFSKIIEMAQPVYFPETGTDLEKVSMAFGELKSPDQPAKR